MWNRNKWSRFSIAITLMGLILIVLFDIFLDIPQKLLKPISIISGSFCLIFLFIASKTTIYDHRFSKHPSSFIAQTQVNDKKNTTALVIFTGFPIFLTFQSFIVGYLFSNYFSHLKYTKLLASFLYGAVLCVIWMGSVQIDISRIGHLVGVLGMFAFYLTMNICTAILLINLSQEGVQFNPLYFCFAGFEILSSIFYMISYLYDLQHTTPIWFQPGLLQKFWIISFVISLMAYADLFSQSHFYQQTFFE
ncbi:hypothetical protein [Candidatus Lokiarchaeum ossiferum]|uniref:hypothetical protein n=1 Tax=Candidatus Lokiarchaeum ossiferum TaxID=2951803 RepID=UPI00352E871B